MATVIMITSPDGKRRMLLNTELVFAYMENEAGGTVNAISHTGAALEIPMAIEDVATLLEEAAADENEVMLAGETN